MTRHYCDKCGTDCGETRWPIAFEHSIRTTKSGPELCLVAFGGPQPRADLCRDCYTHIAALCRVDVSGRL